MNSEGICLTPCTHIVTKRKETVMFQLEGAIAGLAGSIGGRKIY